MNQLITYLLLLPLCQRIFRDADDAVHARDGYDYDGYRLRVEFPRGGGGGGGGFRGGRGGGERGRGSRGPPARRSQFRVLVTGMEHKKNPFRSRHHADFGKKIVQISISMPRSQI